MAVGQIPGAGLHPREDDQLPYLVEEASDWDGGGEEDPAYLQDILLEHSQIDVVYRVVCHSDVWEKSLPA